jgi:hypothetical protein
MMMRAAAVGGLLAVIVAVALAVLPPLRGGGAATAAPPSPCTGSGVRLSIGGDVSPTTGQQPLVLRLTNRGHAACTLFGYPVVSLADAGGHSLPFRFSHRGSRTVTGAAPPLVELEPGGTAVVLISKYRCDRRAVRAAVSLRVRLPYERTAAALPLRRGSSTGQFCGVGDPGSTLDISPFEPRLDATLATQ